ncbi:hypothetical protein KUTeg_007979 [Tegillarca granosa]|uniref:Photolyase/cryptochrome alpha/beta domain-containing protein n=1 Tax=Tegillarca granosa TaxID=220873 RepID=A0ABQ9FEW0_TEGGR|nr:hypothetical protein KUTeg_007979 [Tegillarca granosa]
MKTCRRIRCLVGTIMTFKKTTIMPPVSSPKPAVRNEVGVHWFRHGLRLHDNPSLLECTKNCREDLSSLYI